MRYFVTRFLTLAFVLAFAGRYANAQCTFGSPLMLQNQSFEGPTGAGIVPTPWTGCMISNGYSETPDTQPGVWGDTLAATDGTSYAGLVHEPATGWQEGVGQQLGVPMDSGTRYTFSIDLANSSVTGGGIDPGCAECQVWGGYTACDTGTLLWHSGNIYPFDQWQTDTVSFTATKNYTWIMFRVNSLGCSTQPYILIDNIRNLNTFNATVKNITCYGQNTGAITLNVVGQNPPFTYAWSSGLSGDTSSVISSLAAGSYTVTVTDNNGCHANQTFNVIQPTALVITPTVIPVSCYGNNSGSAYLSINGGTQPYNIVWSNGDSMQSNPNLFAGTYLVTVTDDSLCTASDTIVIAPSNTIALNQVRHAVTCYGPNTGYAEMQIYGSPQTISFQWSNGATTAYDSNLVAGTYYVTATYDSTCTHTDTVLIPPYRPPLISVTTTPVTCNNDSAGSALLNISGNMQQLAYVWSNGATTLDNPNLVTGTYYVTAYITAGIDSLCSATDTAVITLQPGLPLTTHTTDVSCFGNNTGGANILVTGGTQQYTFAWNNGATTQSLGGLYAGTYYVTVTQNNLCHAVDTVNISQPAQITIASLRVDATCYGLNTGVVFENVSGGVQPYVYTWSNGETAQHLTNLTAGSYYVTITDNNGCVILDTVPIGQPAPLHAVISTRGTAVGVSNGRAVIDSISGGTHGYTEQWSNGTTGMVDSNLTAGMYTVTITDTNGCMITDSVHIQEITDIGYVNGSDISVYPNPAHNELMIDINTATAGLTTLNMVDILGRQVMFKPLTQQHNSLDISQLAAGVYMVEIRQGDGLKVIKVVHR